MELVTADKGTLADGRPLSILEKGKSFFLRSSSLEYAGSSEAGIGI